MPWKLVLTVLYLMFLSSYDGARREGVVSRGTTMGPFFHRTEGHGEWYI